jgi:AAA+ ATPase superfamily predicted ATPase
MIFHNRTHEIQDIRRIIASDRSELVVVYGRRGVGKTALVAEAIGDLHHFSYQATAHALPQQLADLAEALQTYAPEFVVTGPLPSVDSLWSALTRIAKARPDSPVIAVIDELPYLAQSDPAVPSVMQRWWDGVRREGIANLKVFLLGSMMSWMEEQTLSDTGPLYNRRTGQLRVEPLGYLEAALFYPSYDAEDRIGSYAIWGGLPSYLSDVKADFAMWENVRQTLLGPALRLAEEPAWLRFADLRSDGLYSSILRAVASGCHRPSEIADSVGKRGGNEVLYHLNRLCDLRLIERKVPIHLARARHVKNALYKLCDHYVAFWYRYLDRFRNLVAVRQTETALLKIQEDFDRFVSLEAFEDVCRQSLWGMLAAGSLPSELAFEDVGPYWIASEAVQDEIDVVAMDNDHAVLLGECKWSSSPMDMRDFQGLRAAMAKANHDLNPIDHPWRALFSRSGFSDDLVALARSPEERLLLFTPDDLYAPGIVETATGG